MNKSTRYSPEVRERAVRLVFEHQGDHASQWAALISIASKIGCTPARALEGVPLGVKDLQDAEGLVTSQGSLPFKDHVAPRDSTQVARLRAAGAIVVGKTNAPEFGYAAITKNLVYGVTRNPWDLERTPGGSSGGSSAALAAGALPLVTGSDGGGSIRIPASFTGAFGLKPSFGRIPMGPVERWVYEDTSCVGPLTKTPLSMAQQPASITGNT